jgi:hypothetical protein
MTYYGLVYAVNLQRSTGIVASVGGSAQVQGAMAVDGPGGVSAAASGRNVYFDDRVFPLIKSYSTAAAVQGTWRELPGS